MKKIQLYVFLGVVGSFWGLNAIQKVGFINDSGQDLYARIRTQRVTGDVKVIHPTLKNVLKSLNVKRETDLDPDVRKDIHEILNPLPDNREIFLFKKNGVVLIPVNKLANDLRIRLWKTNYKPTIDGALKTSQQNKDNSFLAVQFKDLKKEDKELIIYSIKNNQKLSEVDGDIFKQRLENKEFNYSIDLESTEYHKYYEEFMPEYERTEED